MNCTFVLFFFPFYSFFFVAFVKYFEIHLTVSEHCAFAEKSQVKKCFYLQGQVLHIVAVPMQRCSKNNYGALKTVE